MLLWSWERAAQPIASRWFQKPGFHSSKVLNMWEVVKIMVPFWVLITIRHLMFRVSKKGP